MANTKGIDVDAVMEAVNRAVAAPDTLLAEFWTENRTAAPNLAFLYPPRSKSLEINLDLVARNWEIEPEFALGSNRRGVGRLVVAFKGATRWALRWYINPIVFQVRKFNMLVTRSLHDLGNNVVELEERVAALEQQAERVRPPEAGAGGAAGERAEGGGEREAG